MTVGRFFGIGKVVALRPGMLGRVFATRVLLLMKTIRYGSPPKHWIGWV